MISIRLDKEPRFFRPSHAIHHAESRYSVQSNVFGGTFPYRNKGESPTSGKSLIVTPTFTELCSSSWWILPPTEHTPASGLKKRAPYERHYPYLDGHNRARDQSRLPAVSRAKSDARWFCTALPKVPEAGHDMKKWTAGSAMRVG